MAARSGCSSMATVTLVGLALLIAVAAVAIIVLMEWLQLS
jgi:hypothetical protein